MALGIGNSLGMLNASTGINETQRSLSEAMKKLASGRRLTSASVDPAALVITEKMNAQLVGLSSAATQNESTINMVRTAESALGKMSDQLLKARQLVLDTANTGGGDTSMRKVNQRMMDEILGSLDRVAQTAQFGTKNLLDGSLAVTPMTSGNGTTQTVTVESAATSNLGKGATYNAGLAGDKPVNEFSSLSDLKSGNGEGVLAAGTADQLNQALAVIDKAIGDVAAQRGKLGALEADFLEPATDSFRSAYQNLQESESTIADTDMAKETARVTQENIRNQVKMALMAQGKENSQTLLQLLMSR